MAEGETNELANAAKMYWAAEGYAPGGTIRAVDYATQRGGAHALFEGIRIVDCDTHITEAPDLFTSRAPAKYKDQVPRLVRDANGSHRWTCGGRDFGWTGGNVITPDHQKLLGRLAFPTLEEGHEASWCMKSRVRLMDEMGVWAHIAFQNSGVTQAGSLMALGDNELGLTIVRIFNDASAQNQAESGQRVFPMAHLPYWDRAAMIAEAHRCLDLGLKGFVLPDKPEKMGTPRYTDEWWAPLLSLCNETGTPISYHINSAMDPSMVIWEGLSFERKLTVYPIMYSLSCAATLGNWMVSGLLDRYPKLKIGLIEAGMGWVPFVLEMLEHQFDEMMPNSAALLDKRPWEYFRENFWTTFWFERIGPKTQLETVGVDRVLFETDFPHPTSLYPDVQARLVEVLGDQPYEIRKKVLQDNASRLYNLGL
ncbi:amidohydrolase family protein [Novosphingobium bradum]|uniref:Amidohydrolase family protein n=1 Tax=Novosphingobium bradum TaxID=1737444 RepID=A0ABV7IN90_9SPHN